MKRMRIPVAQFIDSDGRRGCIDYGKDWGKIGQQEQEQWLLLRV